MIAKLTRPTLPRLFLLTALAALAAACGKNEEQAAQTSPAAPPVVAPAPTPDAAVTSVVRALRANDVNAFLITALPPAEVAGIKSDWAANMTKDPVTDDDRRKFSEQMNQLTAPGAEDKLYAQIEPKLKQFDQQSATQLPMMIAMGQGFVQSSVQQNKDLSDVQKTQLTALVDATGKWAQGVKFTDPALIKSAIAALCKTARDLNIKSLDELRALTYDQGMLKAGIALGGVKQVFGAYGLQVDKALDSVKAETLSTTSDAAKVKVTYAAFDQSFTSESDFVSLDGKWYGKQAVDKWREKQAEIAAANANPTTTAPAAPTPTENK